MFGSDNFLLIVFIIFPSLLIFIPIYLIIHYLLRYQFSLLIIDFLFIILINLSKWFFFFLFKFIEMLINEIINQLLIRVLFRRLYSFFELNFLLYILYRQISKWSLSSNKIRIKFNFLLPFVILY